MIDLNTPCECGHPFQKHAHNRKGFVGECLSTVTPDGKFCKCVNFRAAQSTEEEVMPKKAKKQKKAGTPRVGNTNAKPKSNKSPALADYTDRVTRILATYKEQEFEAEVLSDGMIRHAGRTSTSPSAAAMDITGKPTNGWTFWNYELDGERVPLDALRCKKSPLKTKAAAA